VRQLPHAVRALRNKGISIFLVEQNVAAALRISGFAYVLESGRIVLSGTGSELLNDERIRQAYLGL